MYIILLLIQLYVRCMCWGVARMHVCTGHVYMYIHHVVLYSSAIGNVKV